MKTTDLKTDNAEIPTTVAIIFILCTISNMHAD